MILVYARVLCDGRGLILNAIFFFRFLLCWCRPGLHYVLKGRDHGSTHARRLSLQNKFVGSTLNSKSPLLVQSLKILRFIPTSVASRGTSATKWKSSFFLCLYLCHCAKQASPHEMRSTLLILAIYRTLSHTNQVTVFAYNKARVHCLRYYAVTPNNNRLVLVCRAAC